MQERSDEQKQASRENGKLSRGPVTRAGKKRSARNAIKHGLTAKAVVLDNERKQNYTAMLADFYIRFQPQDQFEETLVEDIAASHWRMRRAIAIQTNMMNEGLPAPGAPTGDNFTNQMARTSTSVKRVSKNSGFDNVQRHEARLQLAIQRSIRTLTAVRNLDKLLAKKTSTNNPDLESTPQNQQTTAGESPAAGPQA